MPCDLSGHIHRWPQSRELDIEFCEQYCYYCRFTNWNGRLYTNSGLLGGHVKRMHTAGGRSHPNVKVTSATGTYQTTGREEHVGRGGPLYEVPPFLLQQWPTKQLVVPGASPLAIMRDLHAKLHLRPEPHVFDAFQMLVWRNILSLDVPLEDLHSLRKMVNSFAESTPPELVNPIMVFLNRYGARIWPDSPTQRGHLTANSALGQQGYWAGQGLVHSVDSTTSPNFNVQWRAMKQTHTGDPANPTPEEAALNSPLGRLVKIYTLAMLQGDLTALVRCLAFTADQMLWFIGIRGFVAQ